MASPSKPPRLTAAVKKLLADNGVAIADLPPGFAAALGAMSPESAEILLSKRRPPLRCMDGTTLSVQAGAGLYSSPKANKGPYEAVEVGFPSARIPEIMRWAENADAPTGTVYGCVPVALLAIAIAARGGRDPSQEWRAGWLAARGAGMAEGPAKARRPRRVAPDDPGAAAKALGAWMQAATLGSPREEMAARFEIGDAGRVGLDFEGCMAALSKMAPKKGRALKGKPWASTWATEEVCREWARSALPGAEAALLAASTRQAPRAARRRSL